jgi:ABC-type antimicrobial peptide transport system permease subunit
MAYGVSRRVREIGVRIALGAGQAQVVRLVLGRSMRLAGLGLLIGLVGAVAVGQALRSQLLGVSPRDPLTFAGVGLLLAAVALAASASGGACRSHDCPEVRMTAPPNTSIYRWANSHPVGSRT